jgi:hypothetical protein
VIGSWLFHPRPPLVAASVLALVAACGGTHDQPPIRVVDLVGQLPQAVTRPADGVFTTVPLDTEAGVLPAIVVPPASRMTWSPEVLPRRGVLSATAGVTTADGPARVSFRVGISDGRVYETLAEQVVATTGAEDVRAPVRVDLGRYGGPQWRIFYRPDNRRWSLILATALLDGTPRRVYWVAPGIDTDRDGARRYHARTARPGPR